MKIGKCDSIEAITSAHWQQLVRESRVGWPMLRERIVDLCGTVNAGLENANVLHAAHDAAMARHVASIIQKQTGSLLQGLT